MSELTYLDGIAAGGYQPGACNIGPAEVRRRRMAGHAGMLVSAGLLAGLVLLGAPPMARLLILAPAAVSASGSLQAHMRFCANYG
ncbi:MAG TPA: hypothetical protein VLA76_03355, partial [Candidatus Angelobacter sp.]|nr:hypothetical protein [Candidatus Angelobacter sp.]